MRGSHFTKAVLLFSFILLGLFLLAGCCGIFYKPAKPFSYEKIPEKSVVSMNFNAKGRYFVADKDGEAVRPEKISFESLLTKANKRQPEWIKVLGNYTLFQINEGSKVWLCDKELQCVEGRLGGKAGKETVFSLNYGDDGKMFFADRDGNQLEADGKGLKALTNTSTSAVAQDDGARQQKLRQFTSLVEENDFIKKDGIKTLNSFVVYKVKGSHLFVWRPSNTSSVYVCCIDDNHQICGFQPNGQCPPGLCPR